MATQSRRPPTPLALSCVLVLSACPAQEPSGQTETGTQTQTSTQTATSSGSETTAESETGDDPAPRPERLLLSADWRAKRLSLLDYAALRDGAATRDEALYETIELDAWEPGPLEAELSPDGTTAVVAIAPGFFAGAAGGLAGAGPGTVPEGGALLIVDIETKTVLAELETAQYPMGIAFTDDGGAAWTANYGGNGQSGSTVSHIDLASLTIVEELDVGPNPEQLDIDGSLVIVNTAGDGSVRVFDLTDAAGTMSAPLFVSNDPSWVLHLGGARAIATNSLGPPGYSLIDIADPAAPALLETIEVTGIPYAATHGYVESEIIISIIAGTSTALQLYDTDTGTLTDEIEISAVGFPLGIAFAPEDGLAFVPIPGANVLAVADFETGEHRVIPWQGEPGPTYVSLE